MGCGSVQQGPEVDKKCITMDDILSDSKSRVWVDKLPDCFREATQLPYTEEEIAESAAKCNVTAEPAQGREPKLVFQLGAAGTGKSTRMEDCYETMELSKEGLVVADGDLVRESHTGLKTAFGLTKATLLAGMAEAKSPELEEYTKLLAEFNDDHPVGFKDSETWSYNDSGKYKDQFASEALAARKDVVMGVTNLTHFTKKYKSVIDDAIKSGSTIAAMATFVEPEELVNRQVGRGKRKGRLVQSHKEWKDGNLITNAELKQKLSIEALPYLSELVKEHSGTLMLFDNTPNYFKDPSSKQGPFWVQKGASIEITYDGPATVEGMMEHISKTIQKC